MTAKEEKQMLEKQTLRLDEAADLMAVSVSTVSRWIRKGLIQAVRTPGGRPRVVLESLRPYL